MDTPIIILVLVGGLALIVGGIMVVIAAFRASVWWGLAYLFLPFANLVFILLHWAEAKRGFVLSLAGFAMVAGGVVFGTKGPGGAGPERFIEAFKQSQSSEPAQKDLNTQIQEMRDEIERMEGQKAQRNAELAKQFQELNVRRTSLKPEDAVAMQKFTADADTYKSLNNTQRQLLQDIEKRKVQLQAMLDERSWKVAENASKQVSAKKVVMYTTASCPACHAAKTYFARKGVSYEEKDVNNSPEARQEFEKLGGRGVPLILVGSERMEGFNAQRLDQLL